MRRAEPQAELRHECRLMSGHSSAKPEQATYLHRAFARRTNLRAGWHETDNLNFCSMRGRFCISVGKTFSSALSVRLTVLQCVA
jgi:hypothetical protein